MAGALTPVSRWRRRAGIAALSLLLLAAVLLLSQHPPRVVQAMGHALNDGFFAWSSATPPDRVVFIEIENDSVRAFGRWPWPRERIAEGLQRMERAEVIGLDMVFAEPTTKEDDRALAAAIRGRPFIGGTFLSGPRAGLVEGPAYSQLLDSSLTRVSDARLFESKELELPVSPIREAYTLLAALNTFPDADQQIRRYPLAFWVRDAAVPNLGVQMWRLGQREDLRIHGDRARLGEKPLPMDQRGRSRLNFYPDADAFERITWAELMAPDWDPERLAGRWVIVGVSEAGVTDMRPTPVGHLPGPLIHQTFVANLMDGSLLRDPPLWARAAVLLAVVVLVWGIMGLRRPWLRLPAYLAVAGGLYAAGLALYLRAHVWPTVLYPLLLLGVLMVLAELWLFMRNRAETDHLRAAFSNYVAPQLVDRIVSEQHHVRLGGQRQPITALFADIRNFTPLTESLETEELVALLNDFFGHMIGALQAHYGSLDKLMGDGIMALFNAPLDDPDHAYHACLAAAAMQYALADFNARYPRTDVRHLGMGIGLNTGEGIVGNIGASNRFNYTAIGDAVNVAARLEAATKSVTMEKNHRVDILMGSATHAAVRDRLPCYSVGELMVKGKSEAMMAWALDWRAIDRKWLDSQVAARGIAPRAGHP